MVKINSDIDLLWVVTSSFERNWGLKSHSHKFYYHLFFVKSGTADFVVGGEQVKLRPGMCMFACPGVVHEMDKVAKGVVNANEIKFVVHEPSLDRKLAFLPSVFECDTLTSHLIQEIIDCGMNKKGAFDRKISKYHLHSLIFHMLSSYSENPVLDDSSDTTIMSTKDFSNCSKDVVKYIEENYKNEISLNTIAEAVGYNKNYICTVFKKDSGITINDYIIYVRIQKAAEMISYSDCDLTQVCFQTGFVNFTHFNRIFKRIVGIPPGQYRKSFSAEMMDVDINSDDNTTSRNGISATTVPVWAGKKVKVPDEFMSVPSLSPIEPETIRSSLYASDVSK